MRLLPGIPQVDRRVALRALAAAAALCAAVLVMRRVPVRAQQLADAGEALGSLAAAAFLAVYVPWMALGIPTAPLALAAGFVLGPFLGGAVAAAGCTLGACAAFLAGRGIAHPAVERLARRVPVIAPLRSAVAAHGFRVVLLLRLAPVMPVPFLNHVLGATPLALRRFFLATLLGTIPSAFVAASVGTLLRNAGAPVDPGALRLHGAALAAALLASVALGAIAVRVLRRELDRERTG